MAHDFTRSQTRNFSAHRDVIVHVFGCVLGNVLVLGNLNVLRLVVQVGERALVLVLVLVTQ